MDDFDKTLPSHRDPATFQGSIALAVDMPVAGSNELRIDSAYLIPGYSITGLNHHSMGSTGTSTSTTSETLFGFGFAYGRFLTENVEIGTSVTMLGSSRQSPGS